MSSWRLGELVNSEAKWKFDCSVTAEVTKRNYTYEEKK